MTRMRKAHKPAAAETETGIDAPAALCAALRVLDRVLMVAVERQARLLGPASLLDPWRGMHLDQADVKRLLEGNTDARMARPEDASVPGLLSAALRACPRIAAAADQLQLTDLDLAVLLIVLAPDLDLRYERIFAYLQDDVARKRPALDLIANLLARGVEERLRVFARCAGAAPLLRHAVVVIQGGDETPALARACRVEALWQKWLLHDDGAAADLGVGELIGPGAIDIDQLPLDPDVRSLLSNAIAVRGAHGIPLRLCVHGPHGAGKLELMRAVAASLGRPLLVCDLRDCASAADLRGLLWRAERASALFGAVLYVHGASRLEQREPQLLRALVEALAASVCDVALVTVEPLPPVHAAAWPLLRIELAYPAAEARRLLWRQALEACDLMADREAQERVAARFSLSAAQIRQAVAEAQALAAHAGLRNVGYGELAVAARLQGGNELAKMAQRIVPRADFESLVVPSEVEAQLREICMRVATRDAVGRDWAQDSVHARATGVTALFVGPSGTGKTLSAEAVARELGLDLYRIDLAGIVSKYIGETEKNLDRVFAAAEHANAVLFFDEADALFGKRSEVKDAHDRYANIEIAYLLQKMEQFDGLAILATNLKQNLDEAFARRLTFTVTFPFPEEPERRRLWEQLWPPRAARAGDIDFSWFAREFRLSGGNIRNTVMAAAHLAAADGKTVTRDHLMRATRREYQKLGKNLMHPGPGEGRAG